MGPQRAIGYGAAPERNYHGADPGAGWRPPGRAPACERPEPGVGLRLHSRCLRHRERAQVPHVMDEFMRECLAIDVASSIRSVRVIDVLTRLISEYGGRCSCAPTTARDS